MKKMLLALTLSSLASFPLIASANAEKPSATKEQTAAQKQNKAFAKNLQYVSFLPVLMRSVMKNRAELGLTENQLSQIKTFQADNGPILKGQIAEILKLEKEAKELTLKDAAAKDIIAIGDQVFKLRHDIMVSRIACRDFLKTVLTAEQYQKTLASVNKKGSKKDGKKSD